MTRPVHPRPGGVKNARPLVPMLDGRWDDVRERFWDKVQKEGHGGCWVWTGARNNHGYGRAIISRYFPNPLAHRLAWVLHRGKDPGPGLAVCHSCDNPSCVNPAHLWLGTDADNHADMMSKGRWTPNPRWGENHPQSKLSNEQRRSVAIDGRPADEVAAQFGIHPHSVDRIRRDYRRRQPRAEAA